MSFNLDNQDGDEIWQDMLIREAKMEARRLGVRVPDMEEALATLRAIADSQRDNDELTSTAFTSLSHPHEINKEYISKDYAAPQAISADQSNVDDDETDQPSLDRDITIVAAKAHAHGAEDSIWLHLPADITYRVHQFLGCIDSAGYLQMLCHGALAANGGLFHVSELEYRYLCEQIFPHQFQVKKLQLLHFKTWREMAIYRPRLRTNGFYSLKTMYTKPPCNDNFWEEKKVKSLETIFYRHLRFYDDGKCLYSLSVTDPWSSPFKDMRPIDKKIYCGQYFAKGRNVEVHIDTHYCSIEFTLQILDGDQSYSKYGGNHSVLRIISHRQLIMGQSTEFSLPINCDLRFYRRWFWRSCDYLK